MAARFFGQFLIEKKVISGLKLLQAIELQEKTNKRFGDLVLTKGLMTEKQIHQTHRAQRHEDLRFGDMAVKLGFLDENQVNKILKLQRQEHLYIGEALIKTGAITAEELEHYLTEFNRHGKEGEGTAIDIPPDLPNREIWSVFADMTFKMLTRIAGVTLRTGKVTLIHTIPVAETTIVVKHTGDATFRYILTMSNTSKQLIATSTGKGEPTLDGAGIDAAVIKFVNIICGNAISKASRHSNTLSCDSAIFLPGCGEGEIPPTLTGLLFPIFLSNGEQIDLVLEIEKDL